MKGKTLRFILPISLLMALALPAAAQQNAEQIARQRARQRAAATKKEESAKDTLRIKGVSLQADLFGYLYPLIGNGVSSELAVDLNVSDRFFPIVEVGYGSYNHTEENNGLHYKSSAPYARVGLNYNFLYKKGKEPGEDVGFAGFRYAFSSFKYDFDGPPLADPVWGGSVPVDYRGVSGNCHWAELCGGIKAHIYKNLYMGWTIRYKMRICIKNSPHSNPWYIPGFGENGHTTFGGTYSIIYRLPFKTKKR